MYVPAENVYYELFVRGASDPEGELREYCAQRNVIPTSPNTMQAYLQLVSFALRGLSMAEGVRDIHDGIRSVGGQLDTFTKLNEQLGRHLDNASQKYTEALPSLSRSTDAIRKLAGDPAIDRRGGQRRGTPTGGAKQAPRAGLVDEVAPSHPAPARTESDASTGPVVAQHDFAGIEVDPVAARQLHEKLREVAAAAGVEPLAALEARRAFFDDKDGRASPSQAAFVRATERTQPTLRELLMNSDDHHKALRSAADTLAKDDAEVRLRGLPSQTLSGVSGSHAARAGTLGALVQHYFDTAPVVEWVCSDFLDHFLAYFDSTHGENGELSVVIDGSEEEAMRLETARQVFWDRCDPRLLIPFVSNERFAGRRLAPTRDNPDGNEVWAADLDLAGFLGHRGATDGHERHPTWPLAPIEFVVSRGQLQRVTFPCSVLGPSVTLSFLVDGQY
jgi:hypothetical protein